MPSGKDKKPVLKRDDPKKGGVKPVDAGKGTTRKKRDFIAKGDTQRQLLDDVAAVDSWRDKTTTLPIQIDVRRPNDLFVAKIFLYNLKIVTGESPTLARIRPAEEALMVIELPPQSFGEEAYLETTTPEVRTEDNADFDDKDFDDEDGYDNKNTALESGAPPTPQPGTTKIRMSGPTRLAFVMPREVTSIRYTLVALLDAARTWKPRRSLSAAPEPPFGVVSQTSGMGKVLGELVGSGDFANAIDNMKRSATELNLKLPNDKRSKSLATLTKQFEDIVAKGKTGVDGIFQFEDAVAMPLFPLIAAPYRPGPKITALELPYRVITTPIGEARWAHRVAAFAQKGRNELWHTRATTGMTLGGVDSGAQIRAIWSEDYVYPSLSLTTDRPFKMPLDAQDRRMLVQLMTGYGEEDKNGADYVPRAARAKRLILSPLGGLLDAEQSWTQRPESVDLQQWRHMMALGRDHYVRVVYAGCLLPFGHAASLIKVTERKFEGVRDSHTENRVAVLRQRFFIVVREPVKTYDGSRHATGGHPFPFTSVELLTRITPNLQDPDAALSKANETGGKIYGSTQHIGGLTPRQLFWPMMELQVGGDFRFDLAGTDRGGRRTTFSMPLLFMSEVGNTGKIATKRDDGPSLSLPIIDNVIKAYNKETARRDVKFGGDSICFAPPAQDRDGDPRMPTETMLFKAGNVASKSTSLLNTYPEVEEARVALLAAQRILGKDIPPVRVAYSTLYRSNGFTGPNTGEVFLDLLDGPFNLNFGGGSGASRTDVVGAVASPTTAIKGMSRKVGIASDLRKLETEGFDPASFLGDAKILGSITLANYIPKAPDLTGPGAPKFVTRELPASGDLPARLESKYDWQTKLSGRDEGLLLYKADGGDSTFRLQAITTTAVGDSNSSNTTTDSTIKNFKVNLFGCVVLWFREMNFKSTRGQKPEVRVNLHPSRAVEFGGALEFVNQLKRLLPGDGFSDPAALSVTPSGIEAKYSLTIPKVQVGVFDLSGLSIGARFTLPFDVRPMEVGFNFGERENPFSLTVSLLGGGGFLSIGVGADGIREVEAAIEAGARCAIDLGVASGSVEIKAGIYFHWLGPEGNNEGLLQLTGYVRVHGELDVMCIISISITFNLSLNFKKENGKGLIWGEASVTVEIEVLVFSGEVTVRCYREFVGSPADPKFAQLVPGSTTWSSYCSAFAEA